MFYTITIIVSTLFITVSCDDADLRVVNGRETHQKFLAELLIKLPKEQVQCSAIIISHHWLLTSGHCFDEQPILYVKVNRFARPYQTIPVDRMVIHPLYQRRKVSGLLDYVRHDIALIKTNQRMDIGSLGPIPFDRTPPTTGIIGTISGYGLPDLDAREGDVKLSYCNGLLCTHSTDEQTRPGQGDSGGPLIANGKLVGVDSTSVQVVIAENKRRRRVFHTEYFADIASNYDWIQSVIDERIPNYVNGLQRNG